MTQVLLYKKTGPKVDEAPGHWAPSRFTFITVRRLEEAYLKQVFGSQSDGVFEETKKEGIPTNVV